MLIFRCITFAYPGKINLQQSISKGNVDNILFPILSLLSNFSFWAHPVETIWVSEICDTVPFVFSTIVKDDAVSETVKAMVKDNEDHFLEDETKAFTEHIYFCRTIALLTK